MTHTRSTVLNTSRMSNLLYKSYAADLTVFFPLLFFSASVGGILSCVSSCCSQDRLTYLQSESKITVHLTSQFLSRYQYKLVINESFLNDCE